MLRTLKFSRYLSGAGWDPLILTVHPRAHPETSPAQLSEIPPGVPVRRAWAVDAARHLAFRGRYLRRTALPDRWASWWIGGVLAGLSLVRQYRPLALWSTFPTPTAHRIGATLQRLTGLPWVADFRDSMTEDHYPRDPTLRRAYLGIERRTVARATRLVFTAESARAMYLKRYSTLAGRQCVVIPNGYDEADFAGLDLGAASPAAGDRPLTLVHAGLIYPEERDPRPFFRALAALRRSGEVRPGALRVDLRAPGSDDDYRALIAELGIQEIVRVLPALPYRQALEECARADGLLLMQGPSCNHQIPAKAYEYLRLGRPILALTSHEGDTAALLRDTGGATIVDLMDEGALRRALPEFLTALETGRHPAVTELRVRTYARQDQAHQLAACLDEALTTDSA